MSERRRELVNNLRIGKISRRNFIKTASILGLSMSSIQVLLAACSPETSTPGSVPTQETVGPRRGGTLVQAIIPMCELDPAIPACPGDTAIIRKIYNPLVMVDREMIPRPMLAETWEPTDDLLTWTFNLRRGVKWHHGREFNADDVVYTMDRIMDPGLGAGGAALLEDVTGVEKVDDYTVRFHLEKAQADLPYYFTQFNMFIVAHDWHESWITDPSGTGPFKMKEIVVGDHVTVVRNEDYWDSPKPYVDELTMLIMAEPEVRAAAVAAGQVDICDGITPETALVLEGPDVNVVNWTSPAHVEFAMKMDLEPFTDPRVRQAFKLLLDREAMLQAVKSGFGDLGQDHPIAPSYPLWTDIGTPSQDIEKAKQLLSDAGFSDGLEIEITGIATRSEVRDSILVFQERAKEAGVTVIMRGLPEGLYWERWLNDEAKFCVTPWTYRPVPSMYMHVAYKSTCAWPTSRLNNPVFDRLLEESDAEPDFESRKSIYEKIERLLQEDGASIVPIHVAEVGLTSKRVKGFVWGGEEKHYLENVWLED